jgi:prepilin-type processing-associated H-X9-DG protein
MGFTTMELLVTIAILLVLGTIGYTISQTMRETAHLATTTQKLKDLGAAFVSYTVDSGGELPMEDSPGPDDWQNAAKPEHSEAWYNALPLRMGHSPVGELSREPELFYSSSYPLFIPGAPYPKDGKKLTKPYFAVAMNSRLQRKDEDGLKKPGMLSAIADPVRTVAFLERGMPGDKKSSPAQGGFDAGPKANPRAFAARHNQKGLLVFVDGHVEPRAVSELIARTGQIIYPQNEVVWTPDPEDDPN